MQAVDGPQDSTAPLLGSHFALMKDMTAMMDPVIGAAFLKGLEQLRSFLNDAGTASGTGTITPDAGPEVAMTSSCPAEVPSSYGPAPVCAPRLLVDPYCDGDYTGKPLDRIRGKTRTSNMVHVSPEQASQLDAPQVFQQATLELDLR
eukprot:8420897-Karenia_brevis.AAC.1